MFFACPLEIKPFKELFVKFKSITFRALKLEGVCPFGTELIVSPVAKAVG